MKRQGRFWLWARFLRAALFFAVVSGVLAGCGRGSPGAPTTPSAVTLPAPEGMPPVGIEVGYTAPDFTLRTLDGRPLTRRDLLTQEKPFILYFFATW